MIFYEKEYVENLLNRIDIRKIPYKDLSLIARYLKTVLGKNKTQIYNDLVEYCQLNNPEFNEILARRKLKNAIKSIDRYDLKEKIDIVITKSEMDVIRETFEDYKYQKTLFIMLILSKFEHYRDHIKDRRPTKYDVNYYTNQKLTKILKMAKVYVAKEERYEILYNLEQSKLITTTMVGSFQINFVNEDSENEVLITNLNDMESFFPYYCIHCGKHYERTPYAKSQLCNECYVIKRRATYRDSKRKMRSHK